MTTQKSVKKHWGTSASTDSARSGFTLVELLVAVAIIGILAGLVFYSLLGAQVDARNARTRGTIQKINEIILQRWEEYRYRPIDLRLDAPATAPSGAVNLESLIPGTSLSPISPRELARARMIVLRDTMRMEMPDRITDLLYGPVQYTVAYRPSRTTVSAAKIARSVPGNYGVLYKALYNRIAALQQNPQYSAFWSSYSLVDIDVATHPMSDGTLTGTDSVFYLTSNTPGEWWAAVQSSELLYLIVANSNYFGSSALEFFGASEVGDTDEDGLLEFVDAWGQSIHWIRWPAGYPGDLVRYADSDAMDPLRTDWRFRAIGAGSLQEDWKPRTLVPLIVSRGNDAQFGITFDFYNPSVAEGPTNQPIAYADMVWRNGPTPPYGTTGPLGVANAHFAAGSYYYPDPNATWDFQNGGMNNIGSEMPYPESNPMGYRANQIGSIPNFDASGNRNESAEDNITNHDVILEP